MSILDDLNPEQQEAVLHEEGPLLIFAGAGSGKTRALTYRLAYLVRERGVRPERILAVTFTNKAANEMKERIEALVGDAARRVWAGTFHAMAARMLRQFGRHIDIQPNFTIFDTTDQRTLIKECLSVLDVGDSYPLVAVHDTISNAKNELITQQAFRRHAKSSYDRVVGRAYALYQERLAANNALDFDDLIMRAVELLETVDEAREHYQQRFQYVLVDEYQDINHAQYRLVGVIAAEHGNICVVGDDDQSIYGWRGANVQIILDFEDDHPDAAVVKLEQNYRSTQKILDCAWTVVKNNPGRAEKRLWTDNPPGDNVIFYQAVDEQEEATFVANTIRQLAGERRPRWSDFAVLYRTNAQSRVLEEACLTLGIPYRVVGGVRFYDRRELKDAIAYLRVIHNPNDGLSLRRIINTPTRGIGAKTISLLDQFAAEHNISLFEAVCRATEIEALPRPERVVTFASSMQSLRDRAERLDITQLTKAMLDESGYLLALQAEGTAEAATRRENLQELITVTQGFQKQRESADLASFLEHVALLSDIDALEDEGNSVALMTLHAAKGLEFPTVFMAGMEERLFPHERSLNDGGLEEERRLCYVGMTRAQQRLLLTYAFRRTIFGQTQNTTASRFLNELPSEFVDHRAEITELKMTAPPPDEVAEGAFGGPKLDLVKILNRQRDRTSVDATPRRARSGAVAASVAAVLPDPPKYKAGTKVRHAEFGDGIVITEQGSGDEAIVTVAFKKGGIKKLSLQYAHLETRG
ncbi:MAG: ATP-dependent helicase [Armatimonadota bacterium]